MNQRILLVFGPGRLPDKWQEYVSDCLAKYETSSTNLDLLAFRDDSDDAVAEYVNSVSQAHVQELSGARYLARIDTSTRDSISEFVEGLRKQLFNLAKSSNGKRWAERFGQLWWKATVSEKNSPADDMWWQMFRAAAVKARLEEEQYERCIVIGDSWFVGLIEQVAASFGLRCDTLSVRVNTFSFAKVIFTRLLGGIFYFVASIIAKRHERSRRQADQLKARYLIHTFFPKVWTDRFGGWKDMYYGSLPQLLTDDTNAQPIYALRAYDSTDFVSPSVYRNKLKMLNVPEKTPQRYALLESFAGLGTILRAYLSFRDIFNYSKLTRQAGFDEAFVWEGLDVGEMLKDRLWRSVLVYWPNLEVLENSVERMSEKVQPQTVVTYCFEFIFGRAIISGTRQGAPDAKVVGLQHGPISAMKMLYSGVESERNGSSIGVASMPEPDVFSVDGAIAARILLNRGIPQQSILTPGAARFDDVWAEVRKLQRSKEGHDRLRVLVAPGLHDSPFVLGLALKALADDSRLELILKPHPKVSAERLTKLLDSHNRQEPGQGAEVKLVKTGSIYDWMIDSDIFLSTYSSVGVEAIAFGLPVILMLPNSTPDMSMFHGHDVPVLRASTADELKEHVNKIASEPEMVAEYTSQLEEILFDSFGPTDSGASHHLADICASLQR